MIFPVTYFPEAELAYVFASTAPHKTGVYPRGGDA
jgi:uncharacterized protein YuzE